MSAHIGYGPRVDVRPATTPFGDAEPDADLPVASANVGGSRIAPATTPPAWSTR
jgi:hypothetical protein